MLRLVHPAREGQAPVHPRRKGQRPDALSLTTEERRHVRAALRNVGRAYGGIDVLALVLSVPARTLYAVLNPRRALSGTLAIRLAKAAGVSVESILSGAMVNVARCPTCGRRPEAGRAVAGGAS